MLKQLIPSLRATIVLAFLTGIVFPFLVTCLTQSFFRDQADGSLIHNQAGQVIGSRLIGQQFTRTEYFHSRPSAAGSGYCGEASGGTNLGPTSAKLINGQSDDPFTKNVNESFMGVKQLAQRYRAENFLEKGERVPVDAVTRSASGLDPHISEANATLQARRIAKVRSLPIAMVLDLVHKNSEARDLGFLGEPRVNVLLLNLALDDLNWCDDHPLKSDLHLKNIR